MKQEEEAWRSEPEREVQDERWVACSRIMKRGHIVDVASRGGDRGT